MKNVSSLKTNKIESPKTPGGISKSLLTPCRRVGLSRKWKKCGPSPFISPISGSDSTELKHEPDTRKRKECDVEVTKTSKENAYKCDAIDTTPSSHVDIPRRKRSKTLSTICIETSQVNEECENAVKESEVNNMEDSKEVENETQVLIPVHCKTKGNSLTSPMNTLIYNNVDLTSKTKSNTLTPPSNTMVINDVNLTTSESNVIKLKEKRKSSRKETKAKKKSPENLTKECIVVIQKKIFKKGLKSNDLPGQNKITNAEEQKPVNSQTLFDSDSDELPLCKLNKNVTKDEKPEQTIVIDLDEDDDFTENNKIKKLEVKKVANKSISTGSLKKVTVKEQTKEATVQKPVEIKEYKSSSQSSFDDEDDFDFDKKKTILVRKCYDKVTRPLKAKSTGSITQKDIDDLRSRIEVKKKLLLAKAMTEDTRELRDLIKKWQRGCQDALMELMELMRKKFPEKSNMDYSEMLQMLKIPSALVGYDADNDCFHTPDDTSIILSKFSDV